MAKHYSIPADFKKETIDRIVQLKNKLNVDATFETYGNITVNDFLGSGRVVRDLHRVDFIDLQEYISYARQNGVSFSYTINIPYINNKEFTPEGIKQINEFLLNLYEIGVRSITIALPSLIQFVHTFNEKYNTDFKIKASTICGINNVNKAKAYKKMGVDRIVVDECLHRDFATLKEIVNVFEGNVEVITNTTCHSNCLYRNFHYNETGGDSISSNQIAVDFFEHKCMLQRYDNLSEVLKLAWIRPEDIKHYTNIGIKHFKLQGRQHLIKGDMIKTLEYYLKERYDGELFDLLDMFNARYSFKVSVDNRKLDNYLDPFVKNPGFCKQSCHQCNYCKSFIQKIVDVDETNKVMDHARQFYSDVDEYSDKINAYEEKRNVDSENDQLENSFNF